MNTHLKLPRLYPVLDTASFEARAFPVTRAAAAFLEGGAGILQLRHKRQWTRSVFEAAREIAGLCREAGALFIVDDRADIAMLLEAGLHVGQDDLPPQRCAAAHGIRSRDRIFQPQRRADLRRRRRAGGLPGVRSGICHRIQAKPGSGDGDRSDKGVPRAGGEAAGRHRRHHPARRRAPCWRPARIPWR